MKSVSIFLMVLVFHFVAYSQEPATMESSVLESAYENTEEGQLSSLEDFRASPLNLNRASVEDLLSLGLLSRFQAQQLISHRTKYGDFLAVQELQIISGWDQQLIRMLIPFVTVQNSDAFGNTLLKRFKNVRQRLLFRFSNSILLAQNASETATNNYYLGSVLKILFQYRLDKGRGLQVGINADKDAGEYFFKKNNKWGFDFYGVYFFVHDVKKIKSLAIGDYEINMGQGLIHWQSMSFKKSADISKTEKMPGFIKPHTSSGEYNFHRGIATEIPIKKVTLGGFFSFRNLSASLGFDSVLNKDVVSSINTSGYHRTHSEIEGKSAITQYTIGSRLHYEFKIAELNFNSVITFFSKYLLKSSAPYNLFSIAGKQWQNHSIDYKITYENFHLFGEFAFDKNKNIAFCNGALISASPKIDLSFFIRVIDRKFQSVMSGAFTESTLPSNEKGLFAGVSVKPNQRWRVDAYSDFYQFPWLRYLSSFPLYGKDFLLQISYQPDKKTIFLARLRSELKPINSSTDFINEQRHLALRLQINNAVNRKFSTKFRVEFLSLTGQLPKDESGFLFFWDLVYKHPLGKISMNFRYEKFETDSYSSRVYSYEPDLPYSFSLPSQSGAGKRLIYNAMYEIRANCNMAVNISETFLFRKSLINRLINKFYPENPVFKVQLLFQF